MHISSNKEVMVDQQQDINKLRYILYVSTDVNSIRAQRLVPRQARIAVQNVHLLPSKPAFIDGVPFLVRLEDDKMFKGSAALQELQRYWKFLDTHFALEDLGNSLKVGYVNGSTGRDGASFAFPLTQTGTNVVQQQPPQIQQSQQQQPIVIQQLPEMLALPPPNINTVITPASSNTVQTLQQNQQNQQQPLQQQPRVKGEGIMPLPPPQDTNTETLDFNPLRQQSSSGYAYGALNSQNQSQPQQQSTQPPPQVIQPQPTQPQSTQPPQLIQPQPAQPRARPGKTSRVLPTIVSSGDLAEESS